MNNPTLSEKTEKTENQFVDDVVQQTGSSEKAEIKKKKRSNTRTLLLMTGLSLLIMVAAVVSIFFIIRSKPDLVHINDQKVSESQGYVNPESIQQLEYDDKNITMEAAPNSEIFVVCGIAFMAVIAISFIYVKVKDSKDDENE